MIKDLAILALSLYYKLLQLISSEEVLCTLEWVEEKLGFASETRWDWKTWVEEKKGSGDQLSSRIKIIISEAGLSDKYGLQFHAVDVWGGWRQEKGWWVWLIPEGKKKAKFYFFCFVLFSFFGGWSTVACKTNTECGIMAGFFNWASWVAVGDIANVGQLTGVNAIQLIAMVIKAANNARMHKKNCRQFAQHLKLISGLLEQLNLTDLKRRPECREPLELLEQALRKAVILVESCRDKSYLYLVAMGWVYVTKFRDYQDEIDRYLKLIPLISLVETSRVSSNSHLFHFLLSSSSTHPSSWTPNLWKLRFTPEISKFSCVTMIKALVSACMHPLDWLFYPWTNSFKALPQNMVFTTSSISPLIVVELDLSLLPFFSHFFGCLCHV